MLLYNIKKLKEEKTENVMNESISKTYIKFFDRIIPICIMVVAFCFVKWTPMCSFGMTAFWGIVMIAIYKAVVTNSLMKIKNK